MAKWGLLLPMALALTLPCDAQDTPEQAFKKALDAQHEKSLAEACQSLVKLGTADGAKLILGAFAKTGLEQDVYFILVRAAAAFGNSNALNVVGKYVVDNKSKPVARDLVMALHNNFGAACEEAMCIILEGGSEELRVSALEHLMDIGKKPAIQAAIDVLKKDRSPEVRKRVFRLLALLTKQDFGDSESNWTGWWEANKDKPLGAAGGGEGGSGTTTLGNSRQTDYDKLSEAKVLIIRAGDKCKCKKNHDLDDGIDRMMQNQPWKTDSVTKDVFEHDPKGEYTLEKLKQYIAIICICTHIREHCACPTCKPGGSPNMRLYK